MIYVSHNQRIVVEYLIDQSLQGHHPLFSLEAVREAAGKTQTVEEAYEMEPYLDRLLELSNIETQKDYIESLDAGLCNGLVRTYLNVIENEVFWSGVLH